MENNDSNPKPQQTGGLKLMTVFIAVLALHVVVIGGITVYHLMNGGSSDADLVTDKSHKSVKVTPDSATVSDGQLSDGAVVDKNTTTSTPTPDTSGTPVTIPAPPADSTTASAPPVTPAPTSTPAPSVPVPAPVTTEPTASQPSGPIQSGPVITPPSPAPQVADQSAAAPTSLDADPNGGTPYVVKSHESLARIAHRNHVKLAALCSANGLKKTAKVHRGEKLIIPAGTEVASSTEESDPTAPSTGPDRTLLGDSPRLTSHSVSSSVHDKSTMTTGTSSRHTYIVAKGDTLNRIAHRFHTSANALMSLNNISDARKLRPGQKLRIPSQESRSARSTPAPAPTAPSDRIEPRATPSAQLANFIN